MPKLTKRAVEGVEAANKPVYLWDDQLAGFGAKVLPNGQRRYLLKYRVGGGRKAPQRWLMIGTHGAITADQARDIAQQALAAVARGEDPQAQRTATREAPSIRDLWGRYETDHLPRKKASSAKDDRQKWRDHIQPALGRKRVVEVTREHVDRLHKSLADTPYQANRVLALISKLFNLAELWGMRPEGTNPCRHVGKFREQPRERYLNAEELGRLGGALREGLAAQIESPYMVAAIQLLLLTGARLNEILGAQWDWVDWDRRVLKLPDSKTGAKPVFLSAPAIEVLENLRALPTSQGSTYIIQGQVKGKPLVNLAKPWARICKRAGLGEIRLHDLRHTAASIGVGQGMSLPLIGRLLGHTQASTTQRYAHVDLDPALAAAEQIGAAVSGALNRSVGNKQTDSQ